MKKIAIVLSLSIIIVSCGFPNGSINIKHSEYDHYYEMTAKFNPDKTAAVEKWLDKEFPGVNMSFANSEIDGYITLQNQAIFYMKKSPGFLNIKLDKKKNSIAIYQQIGSACQEINEVLK